MMIKVSVNYDYVLINDKPYIEYFKQYLKDESPQREEINFTVLLNPDFSGVYILPNQLVAFDMPHEVKVCKALEDRIKQEILDRIKREIDAEMYE